MQPQAGAERSEAPGFRSTTPPIPPAPAPQSLAGLGRTIPAVPCVPSSLILASRSPRRRQLLLEAGFDPVVVDPPFVDPDEVNHAADQSAGDHAQELAQAKARSVAEAGLELPLPAVILGADTVCIDAKGRGIGKPGSADAARVMLRGFVEAEHRVATGVCLLRLHADGQHEEETSFTETALVQWGMVSESDLDAYVRSEAWRGKAGGYNLFDRRDAGWPIEVTGDETAVVGLPMPRVRETLLDMGIVPHGEAAAQAAQAPRVGEAAP